MDQQGFSRLPEAVGELNSKDKTWGIAIVVLSILGLLGGLLLGAGGAMIGATGSGSGMSISQSHDQGKAMGYNPFGLLLAFYGVLLASICVAHLIGGIGIAKSARWGFRLTLFAAALHILLSLAIIPVGLIGVFLSAVIASYCYSRLKGRRGLPPA